MMPGTRPPGRDRRRAERFPVHANVRMICLEPMTALSARIVNISDDGAAVKTAEPLPYGSLVYLEIQRFHLYGAARVIRCGTRFGGYVAGLEFKGRLLGAQRPA